VIINGFGQAGLIRYNVHNGLSQNSISCIYQDKDGIIWIGTQDGLNRFDGYFFKIYKHREKDPYSISDQFILSIHEDGGNNLIIGTRNGLNLFDKKTDHFINISPDPEMSKQIQYHFPTIEALENGNLIIAGPQDIYEWIWQQKKLIKRINNIYPNNNFSVYKNKFIQADNNKNIFSSDEKKKAENINQLATFRGISQYTDKMHTLWYCRDIQTGKTEISLYDLNNQQWKKNVIAIDATIHSIYFDPNNRAWISTNNGIYICENEKDLNPLIVNGEKVVGEVHKIFSDKDGLIWIGYANNGIALYNPELSAYYLYGSGIKNDPAYGSVLSKNNAIWIASASGLYQFDQNRNRKKILSNYCTAIAEDPDGNIWLGTKNDGIIVLNAAGNKIKTLTKENAALNTNQIFHLQYSAVINKIIASTIKGLFIYSIADGRNETYLSENNKIAGNYVLHSFSDSKGNIWVSSNQGVDVYNTELKNILRLTSNDDKSDIKKTIITSCTEDRKGNIWITTLSNGIYKYNNKILIQYHSENGLSSNYCYGATLDQSDRIWVTTSSGMNVINVETGKIYQLTEQNGLPAIDYSIGSLHIEENGKLYTGSPEGIVEINPSLIQIQEKRLRPIIHNVEINYTAAKTDASYLLDPSQNQMAFEFVAPCFINAGKIIYQYRIRGMNDTWITVQPNNRKINLVELPYQPLSVEIRAAFNRASIERTPITSIRIERQLPFWRKPFVIIGEILLLLFFLFGFIRYFLKRRLRQQYKEVEMKESIYKERERISRDLHDHLGAYAAAIKSNIVQAEKEIKSIAPFQQLKENAEEMVNALRETIWTLEHQQISITNISDRLKNNITRISNNYPDIHIEITEEIVEDNILSPSESIQLVRIIQEALTNALKHSEGSRINIHIQSSDTIRITITDNGKGISGEKNNQQYGIRNMKERAKEAGFTLEILSNEKGTVVDLKKP
jgi:signal transduction histidine kinase/ligand-binding sensor domain-containing protein